SRRRHTRSKRDWSSDVCSSDLFKREPLIGRGDFFLRGIHHDLFELLFRPFKEDRFELLTTAECRRADLAKVTWQPEPAEAAALRSEERRVGKERRAEWWTRG